MSLTELMPSDDLTPSAGRSRAAVVDDFARSELFDRTFREDVYGRDDKLAEALGIAVSLPKPVDDGARVANDVGP